MDLSGVIERCVIEPDGCVSWDGARDGKGYPHFALNKKHQRVFRFLYQNLIAPIPAGHLLHHRCERKWCVNPWHVEPVTMSVHKAFRHPQPCASHCPRGHELTPENTYVRKYAHRQNSYQRKCRICERERKSTPEYLAYMRDYYHRRKGERTA